MNSSTCARRWLGRTSSSTSCAGGHSSTTGQTGSQVRNWTGGCSTWTRRCTSTTTRGPNRGSATFRRQIHWTLGCCRNAAYARKRRSRVRSSTSTQNACSRSSPTSDRRAGCLPHALSWTSAAKAGSSSTGRSAPRRAAARHNVQRGAYLFEDVPGGFMLAWVVVTDEAARQLQDQLRVYVAERLEEFDVQRVLGIGLTPTSKRPYDAL